MKIKVNYDEHAQTGWLCGHFIFYRDDDGAIRNLEAKW